jgi:hypothetical protein
MTARKMEEHLEEEQVNFSELPIKNSKNPQIAACKEITN